MSGAVPFVESECDVGGSYCAAWHDWFWASVEADPACNDEDRDPKPLTTFPFVVADCFNVGTCPLRARAVALSPSRLSPPDRKDGV